MKQALVERKATDGEGAFKSKPEGNQTQLQLHFHFHSTSLSTEIYNFVVQLVIDRHFSWLSLFLLLLLLFICFSRI